MSFESVPYNFQTFTKRLSLGFLEVVIRFINLFCSLFQNVKLHGDRVNTHTAGTFINGVLFNIIIKASFEKPEY